MFILSFFWPSDSLLQAFWCHCAAPKIPLPWPPFRKWVPKAPIPASLLYLPVPPPYSIPSPCFVPRPASHASLDCMVLLLFRYYSSFWSRYCSASVIFCLGWLQRYWVDLIFDMYYNPEEDFFIRFVFDDEQDLNFLRNCTTGDFQWFLLIVYMRSGIATCWKILLGIIPLSTRLIPLIMALLLLCFSILMLVFLAMFLRFLPMRLRAMMFVPPVSRS